MRNYRGRKAQQAASPLPVKAWRWLALQWERYNVLTGGYIFDWWEKLFMTLGYLVVIILVCYGAYKQVDNVVHFATTIFGSLAKR